jgi:hypothetical protein
MHRHNHKDIDAASKTVRVYGMIYNGRQKWELSAEDAENRHWNCCMSLNTFMETDKIPKKKLRNN